MIERTWGSVLDCSTPSYAETGRRWADISVGRILQVSVVLVGKQMAEISSEALEQLINAARLNHATATGMTCIGND